MDLIEKVDTPTKLGDYLGFQIKSKYLTMYNKFSRKNGISVRSSHSKRVFCERDKSRFSVLNEKVENVMVYVKNDPMILINSSRNRIKYIFLYRKM